MTSSDIQTTYSTFEVARLVGLSYRQLDWWIRTGKIETSFNGMPGSGHSRRWSGDDVRRLKHMVAAYSEACEIIAALRSGDLWARSR